MDMRLEIVDSVIGVWGNERVSVRISPRNPYNRMSDSNPQETYFYLVNELEKRKLGILHAMEPSQLPKEVIAMAPAVRKILIGLLILNMGYDLKKAEEVISTGGADAISLGTLFVSNTDLPERFAKHAELVQADKSTY